MASPKAIAETISATAIILTMIPYSTAVLPDSQASQPSPRRRLDKPLIEGLASARLNILFKLGYSLDRPCGDGVYPSKELALRNFVDRHAADKNRRHTDNCNRDWNEGNEPCSARMPIGGTAARRAKNIVGKH
jgi:hypothetical protein